MHPPGGVRMILDTERATRRGRRAGQWHTHLRIGRWRFHSVLPTKRRYGACHAERRPRLERVVGAGGADGDERRDVARREGNMDVARLGGAGMFLATTCGPGRGGGEAGAREATHEGLEAKGW